MSNYALVLDTDRKPLNPCKPGVARGLLKAGKAKVFRRYPFTIILNKAVVSEPQPMQLKLDPGSKVTGIALVQGEKVVWVAELTHRGQKISLSLTSRRQLRRGRRSRKTRYRKPRFMNRARPKGWLPPSLQHRIETTLTWVDRLSRYAPTTNISQELVRFDLQQMENPEIKGVEYQQGTLFGYEMREYLLEKWNRKCTYCGVENVPLQIEHITPKSRGGSDRISNLCLSCEPCNLKKGNQPIEAFLANKPDVLQRIQYQRRRPLRDATAVNATRWALFNRLKQTGLPVETGSGGKTKFNRSRLGLPKAHHVDAACVGEVNRLEFMTQQPLLIKAVGHGHRQMCQPNKYGFPTKYRSRTRIIHGFQSGDIVKAVILRGKDTGMHVGRAVCTASGYFHITTKFGLFRNVNHKYCSPIHRKDGYGYM